MLLIVGNLRKFLLTVSIRGIYLCIALTAAYILTPVCPLTGRRGGDTPVSHPWSFPSGGGGGRERGTQVRSWDTGTPLDRTRTWIPPSLPSPHTGYDTPRTGYAADGTTDKNRFFPKVIPESKRGISQFTHKAKSVVSDCIYLKVIQD